MSDTFKPGERVTATIWGVKRVGTVDRHKTALVWVLWDDANVLAWLHPESLTRI